MLTLVVRRLYTMTGPNEIALPLFLDAYHGFSVAAFETDIYINSLLNEEESVFAPLFNVSNVTLLGQKEVSLDLVHTMLIQMCFTRGRVMLFMHYKTI